MAEYIVVKPIAVTTGEGDNARTTHHSRPGVVVDLTDETAAPLLLGGRIEPVLAEVVAAVVVPDPEVPLVPPETVDPTPETVVEPPVVDPPVIEDPDAKAEGAEQKSTRRRG